jgi:hypothetical protein
MPGRLVNKVWTPSECQYYIFNQNEVDKLLEGKVLRVAGDSLARHFKAALNKAQCGIDDPTARKDADPDVTSKLGVGESCPNNATRKIKFKLAKSRDWTGHSKGDLDQMRNEKCGWFQSFGDDGANVILFNLGQWPLSKNPLAFYKRHMELIAAALKDCKTNPKYMKWREGVQIFWRHTNPSYKNEWLAWPKARRCVREFSTCITTCILIYILPLYAHSLVPRTLVPG